jgi:hypothetical protein
MRNSGVWNSIRALPAIACACLLTVGSVSAANSQNEVAALLVFPDIATEVVPGGGGTVETLFSVSNASPNSVVIRVHFFNGDEGASTYCYECDFLATLSGLATATFSVASDGSGGSLIRSMDNSLSLSCPWTRGFITISLEDESGNTLTDNVLHGRQIVIDYSSGRSHSVSAVPFQGLAGNGDMVHDFDDVEYGKMPRIVATEFIAPNAFSQAPAEFDAYLALFTLGFSRQHPPYVDCDVLGSDAAGNLFSASLIFGCWTRIELEAIHPIFAYPNLGTSGFDEHGWLQINCDVDFNDDGVFDAVGGVHGAFSQVEPAGTIWGALGATANPTAWSRLMLQSVTTGDAVSLELGSGGLPAPAPTGRGSR